MSIEGYRDYKRREFCNKTRCPVQMLMNDQDEGSEEHEKIRSICKNNCIKSTYEFHHWLMENGFLVVRPGAS